MVLTLSSFLFFISPAGNFFPTYSLNPWSLSHTIYNLQPVYATVCNTSHLLSSNVSPSFQPFPLVLPLPFLTPILLSRLFLTLLNPVQIVFQEGDSPGVGNIYYSTRKPFPNSLFSTPHFPAILPFLPQTLLSLDISDIFVLMVTLIFLPNLKLPTIPLKELWLILSSNQTFLSLRSFSSGYL